MAKMTRTELIEALADRYKEGGWVGVADGVQDLTGETLPDEQVYQFDLRIQAPSQAQAQALADTLLSAAEHDESLKVTYALRDDEPVAPTPEKDTNPFEGKLYEKFWVQWEGREALALLGDGWQITTSDGRRYYTCGEDGVLKLRERGARKGDWIGWKGLGEALYPLTVRKLTTVADPLPAVIQWDDRNELKNLPEGTRYRSPIQNGHILWEVLPDGVVAPLNSRTGELQASRWDPDKIGSYAFPMTLVYPEEG